MDYSTTEMLSPREEGSKIETLPENVTLFSYYLLLQKDSELRREFQVFRNESVSISSIILLNFLLTFLIYPQMITAVRHSHQDDTSHALRIIEVILTVLSFICNWGFTALLARPLFIPNRYIRNDRLQSILRSVAIISVTTAISFHVLRRGINEEYEKDYLPLLKMHYEEDHKDFEVCSFWLMIVPIAMIAITREYRVSHIVLVFVLCLFSLLFVAAYQNHNILSYPNIIVYVIIGGLVLFDCLRQQLLQFSRHRQLLTRILAQERSAEQIRRQEMRHMIANVAHDLKSPLASFMNGVELIQADSEYLRKLFKGNSGSNSSITENKTFSEVEIGNSLEAITSILSTTHYVQNINNFMLMTINRCLDSTKASNGLKLVPKNETIALLETLSLPIECLATTQQKIGIELIPWDFEKISPCIITDKQWLQENILCLSSNAIKYSYEGKVTIAVQLRAKRSFPNWDSTYDNSGKDEKRFPASPRPDNDDVSITSHAKVYSPVKPRPQGGAPPPRRRWSRDDNQQNSGRTSLLFSLLLPPKFKVTPENLNNTSELSLSRNPNSHNNPQSLRFFSFNRSTAAGENSHLQSSMHHNHSILSVHSLYHSNPSNHPQTINTATSAIPTEGDQPYLVFEIEDTGIGMSDQAREQLFNPFQQNQRLAGGTGLGLYSLAKRIEALKGYYGVEKRRDGKEGSLFWFAIPYHPDYVMEKVMLSPLQETPSRKEEDQPSYTSQQTSPKRQMVQPSSPIRNDRDEWEASRDSMQIKTERLYPVPGPLPFPEILSGEASERRFSDAKTPTARLFENLHTRNRSSFHHHHHQQQFNYRSSLAIDPSKVLGRSSITAQDLAKAVATARDTLKQSIDSQQTPSYRILIADDAVTVAKVMKRLLERHGHEVEIVENGAAAVKVIQQTMEALIEQSEATVSRTEPSLEVYTPPLSATTSPRLIKGFDLLLMDLHMPIMDGLEATKRIRQFEQERNAMNSNNVWPVFHQKIICVSANGSEETVTAVTESGMDGFIPKPFTYEIFLNAVQSLLQTQPQQ